MRRIILVLLLIANNILLIKAQNSSVVVSSSLPVLSHLEPKTPKNNDPDVIKLKPNFKTRSNPKFVPTNNIHYTDDAQQKNAAGSNKNTKAPSVTVGVNISSFNANGVFPPDPTGEVGANHYVHAINDALGSSYRIYNKSGVQQGGTFTMNQIGNTGGANTGGDPIIIYDEIANRWMLTEFDDNTDSLFISISTTNSPTGTYYTYRYKIPNGFPDYPKYAVWANAYVCGVNDNSGSIIAFNRTNMLAGLSAQMVVLPSPSSLNGFGFQVWQPIDIDGDSLNSSNTPMPMFIRHNDDESHVGSPVAGQDFLQLYQFNINWSSPGSSTFTQVANIGITEFDSDLCGLTSFNCIKQQGTTTELDPLREVVMNKPSYRRFANYESIVCCFSTDVNGNDRAGVRWVELRKVGAGAWTKYQEGTYAPTSDALSRWMPAIAQDKNGNIALAYSVSSSSSFPHLRFTGRKSCDSLGVMTLPENQFATSNNNQAVAERWGDYFHMSVDPVDDQTFWFVGEYVNGSFWDTRIVSFKFNPDSTNASPIAAIIPTAVCGSSAQVKIVIKNTGIYPITSATIRYKLNAAAFTNYSYTGSLAANATDTITVSMAIGAGTNNFVFVTSAVNGFADNYRCDDTLYQTITNTSGSGLAATIAKTNISCNNANNGTITVTVSSGTPPYTYNLNAGAYQSSNSFTSLSGGIYTVNVSDGIGCSGSVGTAVIVNPPALSQVLTTSNICGTATSGTITVTANGGTGAYSYALNTGSYVASTSFTGLAAGTYTIKTKDANNCTVSGTTVITSSSSIAVTGVVTNVSCFGACDGSVSLTSVGGTSPYTILPSNTNLCNGTYTFNVTDANGCTGSYTATITQPTNFTLTATASSAPCGTATTGIINSTVSGAGTYQYQLNGGASQSSGTFTGLGIGVYTVTATNTITGCTKTTTVNMNGGSVINISSTNTSPTCNGDCNGTIIISATNGTGPYQYNLNNQGNLTNNTYNSICGGVYTIVVQDANNCTNSSTINITEPPVLNVIATPTHPLCHNVCNGIISVTATGGTPIYEYKLNAGIYGTNSTFNNRCAGTFTATVRDMNGCTQSSVVTLTNPTLITITTVGDTICANTNTGTIAVTAANGTPGYTYAPSPTGTFQLSNILTNLGSGVYTVVVKDANNCTRTITTTIATFAIPTITTNITNNKCHYLSEGEIDINVVTGVGAFLYNIDGGPWQVSDTFSALPIGTYQINILDGLGCENSYNATITSPSPLVIATTATHITCYDADNGSIFVTATGGTPNYMYAYNTSAYQSSSSFSPLSPSTYTLYVKDTNNCIDSTYVTLTEPTNMYFDTLSVVNATSGANGAIFVNAMGGTPNYQYNINAGPFQLTGFFDLLPGGTYTVMATDDNGCTETRVVVVEFPTGLNSNTLQDMISIYPNPLSGNEFYLNINSDEPLGELNFRMYNMLGQQVTQTKIIANQKSMVKKIELEHFAKAHYTIVVNDSKNRSFIVRLILKD